MYSRKFFFSICDGMFEHRPLLTEDKYNNVPLRKLRKREIRDASRIFELVALASTELREDSRVDDTLYNASLY